MLFITQGKTNWKFLVIVIVLAILVGGGVLWYARRPEKLYQPITIKKSEKVTSDYKNCTYIIEGKDITLKDGYSEEEIVPGSASKLITRYFGNEASGDFNEDGFSDIAFIITQSGGGSGTFYYAVVGLGSDNGCNGTNAIFLGDRVAPQTTEIEDNKIIFNYADRKRDEPMVAQPSIGLTKQFVVEGDVLKEVTPELVKNEQSCLISGGSIKTSSCCLSVEDFPNTCLIGACGCSLENSHQVKTCDCGEEKCWDGRECVSR